MTHPITGVFSHHSTDFSEFASLFLQWNHRFNQMSRGAFEGKVDIVHTEVIQLMRIKVNQVIQARGTHRAGTYLFCPVVAFNQNAIWRGQQLNLGHLLILGPHERVNHLTCKSYVSISLAVNCEVLYRTASQTLGVNLEDKMHNTLALAVTPTVSNALFQCLDRTLNKSLTHQGNWTPKLSEWAEKTCIAALMEALSHVQDDGTVALQASRHAQQMRHVEAYIAARLHQRLAIFDLCEAIHVSERALHYLFQKLHRMSPMAYVKVKRLNSIREELKATRFSADSIKDITRRWGLWHTGDFAADYRRQFGELPSQTHGR